MNLRDEIAAGLEEVEEDFTNANGTQLTFTIDKAYPCCAGSITSAKELGIGGFMPDSDLILNIRRSLFTTLPTLGSTGTYSLDSKTYRIQSLHFPAGRAFVKLFLKNAEKGV